jgi:hypothetical protein
MSGLFSSPKVQQAPQVQVPNEPQVNQEQLDRQASDKLRKRRGYAANLLATGDQSTAGTVSTPTLGA